MDPSIVTVGIEFPPQNGFKELYYRSSSRANGQRNIRCFPGCSVIHNEKNFCGRPVRTIVHLYVDKDKVDLVSLDNICCVGEYKPLESTYTIIEPLTGEQLQSIVRPKPSSQRSSYWGRLVESKPVEFIGQRAHLKGVYEFNSELRGWSYAWHGARFRGFARHVFAVTVLGLDRTATTKSMKPQWPYNLGIDFRSDRFVPLACFDSPSFTFGSFKERADISAGQKMSIGMPCFDDPMWHVPLPIGYDPENDEQLLGLPGAVLRNISLTPASIAEAFAKEDFSEYGVTEEQLAHRIEQDKGLGAASLLGGLLQSAPDLQALSRHKRRVEELTLPPEVNKERLAVNDYFYRLKLLKSTFDPDPVKRTLQPSAVPCSSSALAQAQPGDKEVPFPYRNALFLELLPELLPNEDEKRKLLQELLSLQLVFPVALEPAIYFLLTLRSPVLFDPHCFSRASTLLTRQSTSAAALALTALSRSSTLSLTQSGACFEPLLSLSLLTDESKASFELPQIARERPSTPVGGGEVAEEATPDTLLDEPILQPASGSLSRYSSVEPPDSSGAWFILRMVADHYCNSGGVAEQGAVETHTEPADTAMRAEEEASSSSSGLPPRRKRARGK